MWKVLLVLAFVLGAFDPSGVSAQLPGETDAPSTVVVGEAVPADSAACAPTILEASLTTNLDGYHDGRVPQYGKFELTFEVASATATNPYFPYDPNTPPGVERATGITVDVLLLPPGGTDWNSALRQPCFYYQPVEELGSGADIALLPGGEAGWRCRFTPEATGTWQYRIQVTDACGTSESSIYQFACAGSNEAGFVRVSATDPRFFEFANGTPFVSPLVNLEEGNPFNTLAEIRNNVPKLGDHGIRFVRWFPSGEGANYSVAPYADTIRINWFFGDGWVTSDIVDASAGKMFSYRPYYYSAQPIPIVAGERYRLSFRAYVSGEQVLRGQIGDLSGGALDVCSSTSTYHEAQGNRCDAKYDGWNDYTVEVTSPSNGVVPVAIRGLYVSADARAPYNSVQEGQVRVHSVQFQRYEGDGWGPNLLTRSDADTYAFVDQRAAARLDEILALSEQYGVYHKLPLFHKNDEILNRLLPDGSVGAWDSLSRNFYSEEGQASRWYQRAYARYFIARWSYSPALHSLELANENHLTAESYEAGFALAEYVRDTSPRHILMSNSFWGYFVESFFADPDRGHLLDYGDKHWYASQTSGEQELISTTWDDSAAYVRECLNRFGVYAAFYDYSKPIVRGEGGVAESGTEPQHPSIAAESQGIYYHKKLWAHVGALGYSCDGEWYPRLFVPSGEGQFPNDAVDLFKMFAAYENFVRGEPLNRGDFEAIGTDLGGDQETRLANEVGRLRAWGVRGTGRALLWIDNADHTWKQVVDGASIPAAAGSLIIPGFRSGAAYRVEWWDPYAYDPAEQVVGTEPVVAQADGSITLQVEALRSDVAVKIVAVTDVSPVYLPVVQNGGWH